MKPEYYYKLELSDYDFQFLLDSCIGIKSDYKNSIKNCVHDGDYTTIEEIFTFLRKHQKLKRFKDVTVEGALLGDFVPYELWEFWCHLDTKKRYPNGEFSE